MRTTLFVAAFLLAAGQAAADIIEENFNGHTLEISDEKNVPKIVKLTSPIYQTQGTAAQIIQKAQGCVAKHLSNDEVATSGSSASGFFGAMAGQGHNVNSSIAGGALIELADPANGQLIANSRADYRFMLLSNSVKSRIIIEAKDGRFRITQSNLESVQKNTGSMRNDGYDQLIRRKGTGWDKALAATIDAEKKVVDCIMSTATDNW